MSAGASEGDPKSALHARPAGRDPAPSLIQADPRLSWRIEPVADPCKIFGLIYGEVRGRDAGVIRLDPALWRALCPADGA